MLISRAEYDRLVILEESLAAEVKRERANTEEYKRLADRNHTECHYWKVKAESVAQLPDVWSDLDAWADFQPMWSQLTEGSAFHRTFVPYLRRLLHENTQRLYAATDETLKVRLQVRGQLLQGLIVQPEIEAANMRMMAENRFKSGDIGRDELMDLANGGRENAG